MGEVYFRLFLQCLWDSNISETHYMGPYLFRMGFLLGTLSKGLLYLVFITLHAALMPCTVGHFVACLIFLKFKFSKLDNNTTSIYKTLSAWIFYHQDQTCLGCVSMIGFATSPNGMGAS